MKTYSSLHELLAQDAPSKTLYDQLSRDAQVALQEQRQSIHTHQELAQAVSAFEKRSHK
ncbi:MAG: hypothetical protein IKU70_04955 [Clostridia bacterium]|nr:hypothetical protein [Clostridia bacterium]